MIERIIGKSVIFLLASSLATGCETSTQADTTRALPATQPVAELAPADVQEVRQRAEQGDADAQFSLGLAYDQGQGVPQDEAQAVAWYRKAAEQGNPDAEVNLGVMYYDGRVLPQDDAQAFAWFRKAAEQGNPQAQFNLGVMYYDGRGVAQDDAQAVAWYRRVAEQGDAAAQFNLGWMYDQGRGVAQDDAQAVAWYRRAAEQGDADAQFSLGLAYDQGQGVPQDEAQAVAWYRKAAEQGNADAQVNLGVMYYDGRVLPQDDAQAFAWFRKAAEQGNATAQNNLGAMYDLGRGVKQDYQKALAWIRKAAEQGDAIFLTNVGEFYEYGKGVEANYDTALDWYAKAATQGEVQAQKALERLSQGNWGTWQLQTLVAEQGFDPGLQDGVVGPRLIEALQRYREDRGWEERPEFLTAMHNLLFQEKEYGVATRSPSQIISAAPAASYTGVSVGDFYALVIGIENYPKLKSKDQLGTPLEDARAVAEVLRYNYGFQVQMLLDPTRSEVVDELTRFRKELDSDDSMLIYYAGHGEYDPRTQEGYWLPSDASDTSVSQWLENSTLTTQVQGMPARHVMIVADACYAGALLRAPSLMDRIVMDSPAYLRSMMKGRSRTALTSGTLQPVLDEGSSGHSVFAAAFLKFLKQNEKIIDMDRLSDFIIEEVEERTASSNRQQPRYYMMMPPIPPEERGDFVLIPKGKQLS